MNTTTARSAPGSDAEEVSAAGGADVALEVRGLEVSFDRTTVLAGIDLVVHAGATVALLGPSGCGKTTLLRAVAGFVRPDAGTVVLDGHEVVSERRFVPPERRHVGLVPQEGALFPHMDVGANVGFGLRHIPRGARAERVQECLEMVGLADAARRRPGELSGGEQQRIALARALAPEPAVVLLDEPFSALDAGLRSQLRGEVREVLRGAGATAIMVTHDQEEALSMADAVAVMGHGRIAQFADPVRLYREPVDVDVATFVGESVLLPAVVGPDGVGSDLGPLPDAEVVAGPGGRGHVAVLRPEQLEVVPAGEGTASAVVCSSTYFGHDALLRLRVAPDGPEVLARLHHDRLPPLGETVGLVVHGPVRVFPL